MLLAVLSLALPAMPELEGWQPALVSAPPSPYRRCFSLDPRSKPNPPLRPQRRPKRSTLAAKAAAQVCTKALRARLSVEMPSPARPPPLAPPPARGRHTRLILPSRRTSWQNEGCGCRRGVAVDRR